MGIKGTTFFFCTLDDVLPSPLQWLVRARLQGGVDQGSLPWHGGALAVENNSPVTEPFKRGYGLQ